MSTFPEQNARTIIAALKQFGITNKFFVCGILGTCMKETNLIPQQEKGYSGTSNDRIRLVLGHRVAALSDPQLTALKANDENFFNHVYGNDYGNTSPGDGYRYFGRGFNGLTFKNNYQKTGTEIGVDLINHPELMLQLDTAAKALAAYYRDGVIAGANIIMGKFGVAYTTAIADLVTGAKVANQITVGWGTHADGSEGQTRAIAFAPQFLPLVESMQAIPVVLPTGSQPQHPINGISDAGSIASKTN